MQGLWEIGMQRALATAELEAIANQSIPLDNWWGAATPDDPRLAYERFIDAQRLAVEETYTTEGEAVGSYASAARDDPAVALKYTANFVRSAKFQRLMPHWWNPQHDICMFRLALDETGDFYLYHAMEVSDSRQKWGYETTKLLRALAKKITDNFRYRHDEVKDSIVSIALGETPSRETGSGKGSGVDCRYGTKCKRRDCWFAHPRIDLPPKSDETKQTACSTSSSQGLLKHCIEMAGTKDDLVQVQELYDIAVGVEAILNPSAGALRAQTQAQMTLKKKADEGNPMAQYMFGKLLRDSNIVVLGKPGVQRKKLHKLWTSSALSGCAFAMAGLALEHRDCGSLPTACIWWERALEVVDLPEAAYNLGVAYALNDTEDSDAIPINYEKAATNYAKTVDMDIKLDESSMEETDFKLLFHILLAESPNNDDQAGYQKLAKHNLQSVERYMGNPERAPLEDHKDLSPYVESEDTCSLCNRRPRVGEKDLMTCTKCRRARYCNALCQRGHWGTHQPNCVVPAP